MEEQDVVLGGFTSIPRSDLKIGGDELDERQELSKIQLGTPILSSGNTGQASNDIENANEMTQVGEGSESFVKDGKHSKTQLLGQEIVKPSSSSKLDLNTVVDCNKRALLKRCDNTDAVSSLNADLSLVSSSRRRDKSMSMDVFSECGSSSVPVVERDPRKLWEEMKQNGFLSNPQGGISTNSSSCLVSSSHGGIPAPRKRGRKRKNDNDAAMLKKKKIEIARKEEVDRFFKPAAPTGLLSGLNPGIIHHVRNKKQVLTIIANVVKSHRDAGNLEDVNTDASRSDFNQGFMYDMPRDNCFMRDDDKKCVEDEFSEENNTVGSRFPVADKFSECASSLSRAEVSKLNEANAITVNAATVASQWLELIHEDIKGRVSALRRSKKRVRAVVTTELPLLMMKELQANQENDPTLLLDGASRASTVDIHKTRWMTLFTQFEHQLSHEESELESWLNQVQQLQSHCVQGLDLLNCRKNLPWDFRAAYALNSDKGLPIKAAAASIFSTSNFLEENIPYT